MSEGQSRGIRDFSAYDAMTTEALEEILRSDVDAPVGEESDEELILHVMEVLANRRKAAGGIGKTAQQAWEAFERDYLPEVEEDVPEKKRPVRPDSFLLRRLIASVAAVVLLVCIPLVSSAFGWKELWNVIATWAKETFSFVSSQANVANTPEKEDALAYSSLQDLLKRNNIPCDMVPTWIPDGFVLESTKGDISPTQKIFTAHYTCGNKELCIWVQTYMSTDKFAFEIEEDILETYPSAGTVYYIFSNKGQIQVIWVTDSYECCIFGDISLDEAKMMIDSIGKGK